MKFALVGCGLIGGKRAEAIGCKNELIVAVDLDPRRAEALGSRYGVNTSGDWRAAIDSNADVVIVATAHDSLAELAVAAINAGKHVLVEKPGGRTLAEVRSIADAADLAGKHVKVGYNHRFHPAMLKARTLVDAGELGPLMFIRGRYGHGGRVGYEQEWRFKRSMSGGGELLDQGSHLIDLAHWYLGEFTDVAGRLETYFWKSNVEDNAFLTLSTPSGQIAWLHASWTEWKNMFSLEIYGRDGKIEITGLGGSYGIERLAFYKMSPQMGPPDTTIWEWPFPDRSWSVEIAEFVAAIEDGRSPVGNIHDAVHTMSIVDQLYVGAKG